MSALAPRNELDECKTVTEHANSLYFESLHEIFRLIYCGWPA